MLERLLTVVVPVFLIVLLGWLVAGRRRLDLTDINRLNMDVFVPVLIVLALSAKDFDLIAAWPVALAGVAVVMGSGAIAWVVARTATIDARAFVPSMMFNNCGNMGLPLAYLAFGDDGLRTMVVLFVTSNLLMFTFGTRFVRGSVPWRELLRDPMIVATVLGLAIGILKVPLPAWLTPAMRMVADLAVPLMLLSLGMRMRDLRLVDWQLPLLGAIVCPLTGLLVAPLAASVLPLSAMQYGVLLVFAALPPAVLNYLLAERYQRSPQQVASIVLFGNLASMVVVPIVVARAMAG